MGVKVLDANGAGSNSGVLAGMNFGKLCESLSTSVYDHTWAAHTDTHSCPQSPKQRKPTTSGADPS